MQIKGRDRAEADMKKEIKRLRDEQTVAIYGSEYSKEKFRAYKERIQELEEGIEEATQFIQESRVALKSFDDKTKTIRVLQSLLSKQEEV